MEEHNTPLLAVSFSPDGTLLASLSESDFETAPNNFDFVALPRLVTRHITFQPRRRKGQRWDGFSSIPAAACCKKLPV
jgi:hypothetical protein